MVVVHAHPDDEVINTGATMAMYAHQGAQVTLVTCTLGEEGEDVLGNLSSSWPIWPPTGPTAWGSTGSPSWTRR